MLTCRQCSASIQESSAFCDSCGAPITAKENQDTLIGRTLLNQYVIRKKLGEGGFGAVYIADQPSMSRKVAVKTLHRHLTHNSSIVARFRREGIAASKLIHASSVKMLNFGETEDGVLWMAMEFLDGETLDGRVRRAGPMDIAFFVEVMGPICEVLAEAHEKGIVHRDLKPENIMLVPYPGGKFIPKVLDFGIAGLLDSNDGATKAGMIVGTPQYMSPEQWKGLQFVDFRSDIYALGVIAYQALTATLPFKADTTTGWMQKHCNDDPLDIDKAAPGRIPPAMRRAVMRALAKEPQQRYSSTLEFRQALEDSLKPGADVEPAPLAPTLDASNLNLKPPENTLRVDTPPKKKQWLLPAIGLPLVALLAYGVVAVASGDKDPTPSPAPPKPLASVPTPKPDPEPVKTAPAAPPKTEPTPKAKEPPSYMVRYEGGVFLMGSEDEEDQNPVIEIKVAPFFLDKTEVSLGDYKGCIEAKVCAAPEEFTDVDASLKALLEDSAYPVVNVTFRDAQTFCSWRSAKDALETRLPTESEWEFAAREGGLTKSFPWGNTWDDNAAVSGVGRSTFAPRPVNETPRVASRSDRAIHLIGNVSEWVDTKVPASIDESCASDACRVLRGGSYLQTEVSQMTATYRNWSQRDAASEEIGFRCASTAK